MKKYAISGLSKFIIFFVLLAMIAIVVITFVQHYPFKDNGAYFVLVICFVFGGYITKTLFDISKEKFKALIADYPNRKYYFETKKNEVYELSFDDIKGIYMIKGQIIRSVPLGHVNIITKRGHSLSLTISNIDDFFVGLPDGIEKNLEEVLFYRVK